MTTTLRMMQRKRRKRWPLPSQSSSERDQRRERRRLRRRPKRQRRGQSKAEHRRPPHKSTSPPLVPALLSSSAPPLTPPPEVEVQVHGAGVNLTPLPPCYKPSGMEEGMERRSMSSSLSTVTSQPGQQDLPRYSSIISSSASIMVIQQERLPLDSFGSFLHT